MSSFRICTDEGELLAETTYADVAESCAWALCKFNGYAVVIHRATDDLARARGFEPWKRYYIGKAETDKVMYEYPGQMLYRDRPSATAAGS